MKNTSLLIALCLIVQSLSGQIVSADYILDGEITRIDSFNLNSLQFYQTAIAFGFDEYEMPDSSTIAELKKKTIFKVELYYSSYRDAPSFSQRELNRKRILELQKHLPEVFDNNAIEWELMEQFENKDKPRAKQLFHGFVFYTREALMKTKEGEIIKMGTPEEIALLKGLLGIPLDDEDTSALPLPIVDNCDTTIQMKSNYINVSEFSGKYWPRSKRKKAKGILYDKAGIWKREERDTTRVEVVSIDTLLEVNCNGKIFNYNLRERLEFFRFNPLTSHSIKKDSVVMKTLTENEWKNAIIIEDVTGSMYPYIGQTLLWKRLYPSVNPIDDFVFFNDGDKNPDGPIGRSKGVYSIRSKKIKKIEGTVFSTMKKGNGGDGPENDIEALIRGYDKFNGEMDRIILIADNYSSIRDMEILQQLLDKQIPIDIIVCGAWKGKINYEYLEIARKTNGSVYTMDEQIHILGLLAEGETIKVGRQKFIVKEGELQLTR